MRRSKSRRRWRFRFAGLRTTLDAHAFLMKITLDGIHAEVVYLLRVGNGVVLAAHALHEVHYDKLVVDDVPNSGERSL
jgi:hypothetical protein